MAGLSSLAGSWAQTALASRAGHCANLYRRVPAFTLHRLPGQEGSVQRTLSPGSPELSSDPPVPETGPGGKAWVLVAPSLSWAKEIGFEPNS